jgi:UDP-N-acetylglucosamine acyltransferase
MTAARATSSNIHPTAVVDPSARVAASNRIGPYCVVGAGVEMGDDNELIAHVVIHGPTRIGKGNRFFPFASLGLEPQDLKFKGEPTRLEIGDRNQVRESVTIHRGTPGGGGLTSLGNDCLLMAYAHIAHDCHVGNGVIMANNATLAGHVIVEDFATVGAFSPVHQFCRVGAYSYIGGGTVVTQDVLPFSKTVATREAKAYGANAIGLQRKGFSKERVEAIQKAFKALLYSKLNTTQAVEKIQGDGEVTEDVAQMVRFIQESKRGVIK